MNVVCCFCEKFLRFTEPLDMDGVAHEVCEACRVEHKTIILDTTKPGWEDKYMQVICMFCKKHLCFKEPLDDKRVSHGCCPACEKEQNDILDELIEKKKRIQKYLLGDTEKPPS